MSTFTDNDRIVFQQILMLLEELADRDERIIVPPPDLNELKVMLEAALIGLGHPPTADDIAIALAKVLHIPEFPDLSPRIEEVLKEVRELTQVIANKRFGGGGPSEIRVKNAANDPVNVTLANQPDLTGTWGYNAGASGTVALTGSKRVVGISAHCTTAGSFAINGGDSVPLPANTQVAVTPNAQLVDPSIVFTGTDSYFVEHIT